MFSCVVGVSGIAGAGCGVVHNGIDNAQAGLLWSIIKGIIRCRCRISKDLGHWPSSAPCALRCLGVPVRIALVVHFAVVLVRLVGVRPPHLRAPDAHHVGDFVVAEGARLNPLDRRWACRSRGRPWGRRVKSRKGRRLAGGAGRRCRRRGLRWVRRTRRWTRAGRRRV